MAEAYGMDLNELMEILQHSTGKSFVVDNWEFLSSNWGRMANKDLDLYLAAANEKNVTSSLLQATEKLRWP
jgi:3-hydroxyisobutyrate dehydrogenase-like beta-hydroxyacid dehydrogenase